MGARAIGLLVLVAVATGCAGVNQLRRGDSCPGNDVRLEARQIDQQEWTTLVADGRGQSTSSECGRIAQSRGCTVIETGTHRVVLTSRPEPQSQHWTTAGFVTDLRTGERVPIDQRASPGEMTGATLGPDGTVIVIARTYRGLFEDSFDVYGFEPADQDWTRIAGESCRGEGRIGVVNGQLLQIGNEAFCTTDLETGDQCQWPGWRYPPSHVVFTDRGALLWGARSIPEDPRGGVQRDLEEEVLQTGLEVTLAR